MPTLRSFEQKVLPQSNTHGVAGFGLSSVPVIRVGCAGWSIPKVSKPHFPSALSHLESYAQRFNACEINSSFYRPHRLETWARWAESVPKDFRFAVKAPRTITHGSKLICGPELLLPFLDQVNSLGQKLGPVLFQLPPKLVFEPNIATRFFGMLRDNFSGGAVFEPRHPSWFAPEVETLWKDFRIARVAADPACVPAASQPSGWNDLVYCRLHGSPRRYYSSYSDDFLNSLSSDLADYATTADVWCIFDNTASGSAILNGLTLQARLSCNGSK
jgi:uncharacterized protein YecE (DUF72 family)